MFRNECFCNTFRDVMKFSVGYFEFKSTLFARPDWSHKDAGIGSGMEEREKKNALQSEQAKTGLIFINSKFFRWSHVEIYSRVRFPIRYHPLLLQSLRIGKCQNGCRKSSFVGCSKAQKFILLYWTTWATTLSIRLYWHKNIRRSFG